MENDRLKYSGEMFSTFAIIPGFGGVCPLCVDHERGDLKEYNDCKNLLVQEGKVVAECACCGPKHGRR
jgi:hypothetical protein